MPEKPSLGSDADYPSFEDQQTLDTLAFLTRIFAWLSLLFTAYAVFTFWLAVQSPRAAKNPGALALMFGLVIFSVVVPWLYFKVASCIQNRERRNLIYVASALACASGPLGLALGVYTFIVLERSTIRPFFSR